MNDTAFLQIQSIELQRLLDSVGDDPILEPQLRERLAEVESARKEGRLFPESNVVLRQFLKTLSQHGAELRLALPDAPSVAISAEEISGASERLEREVTQETIGIPGVFRGVTRESGVFDIRLSNGSVITGTVADDLTEDDLERIDELTNQQCIAELQKTTVNRITGVSTPSYVLLDAKPNQE